MKLTSNKKSFASRGKFWVPVSAFLILFGTVVSLACDESAYRHMIVTYFEQTYAVSGGTENVPFDSRCNYFTDTNGVRKCRIRLVGELYLPRNSGHNPGSNKVYSAIVANHGSELTFNADTKWCEIATYYVPKGYIVFAPFRRGQGDANDLSKRSTGIYIDDFVNDFLSDAPRWPHNSLCGAGGPIGAGECYRQQLFAQQANQEIRDAMVYLEGRDDVAFKSNGDYKIDIFGSSYGGQVTTYANTLNLGQSAALIFSPAAHEWGDDNCSPSDMLCGSYTRIGLMQAAADATRPAFYIQSRWDVDTRPTMNLPYAHGTSSSLGAAHARPIRSAIFDWTGGICSGEDCTEDDLDYIHAHFCIQTDIWGAEVTPFLDRYNNL